MNLTDAYVQSHKQTLENYYSAWHTKCRTWLQYLRGIHPNISVAPGFKAVFPPVARRVVMGLAQQIRVDNRRVHCQPARNTQGRETAEAQERSSQRERAHQAAFRQDDIYALRRRRYPPANAIIIEELLFGVSVGVVLPNEMALTPEPERRAGEGLLAFERRRRLWQVKGLHQPALPCHFPGILNLLIDPSGEWFLWKFALPTEEANTILKRWKDSYTAKANEATVAWTEVFSDQKRLVYCEDRLVHEGEGFGFVPLALGVVPKGEPAIYTLQGIAENGPEHMHVGILAGCENVLDDIALKETQIAAYISRRVWPKVVIENAENLGQKFRFTWDPADPVLLNTGPKLSTLDVPDLPNDVWKAVENARNYVDSMTQIEALQGGRNAASGYEQAIMDGLASAVLKPYVDGLNGAETQVAENRGMYVYMSDLFLDGLELAATIGGKEVRGVLKRDDMDSLEVEVTHDFRLPQQRVTEEAFWRAAKEAGGASLRTYMEEGLRREDPESEQAQIRGERLLDGPEVSAVLDRELAYEYDADLMRRVEEEQAKGTERLAETISRNQGGGALAPPGAGLPVPVEARGVGVPPATSPQQMADLIARQAARRKLPIGRR